MAKFRKIAVQVITGTGFGDSVNMSLGEMKAAGLSIKNENVISLTVQADNAKDAMLIMTQLKPDLLAAGFHWENVKEVGDRQTGEIFGVVITKKALQKEATAQTLEEIRGLLD